MSLNEETWHIYCKTRENIWLCLLIASRIAHHHVTIIKESPQRPRSLVKDLQVKLVGLQMKIKKCFRLGEELKGLEVPYKYFHVLVMSLGVTWNHRRSQRSNPHKKLLPNSAQICAQSANCIAHR